MVGVLDNLKGKNVEIKVRELSSMVCKFIDYDDLYVHIQCTEKAGDKTQVIDYYIPHYNVIYIAPS